MLEIKLYWRLHDAPLDRDYSSIVRMRDPGGFVVAEAHSFAPGGLATRKWLTWKLHRGCDRAGDSAIHTAAGGTLHH